MYKIFDTKSKNITKYKNQSAKIPQKTSDHLVHTSDHLVLHIFLSFFLYFCFNPQKVEATVRSWVFETVTRVGYYLLP